MQQFQIPPKLIQLLNKLYSLPASITIITGYWKTGKTDFALFLAEMLKELGLINNFASNIETENSPVQFLNDFAHYDLWMYSNSKPKMYIYDELVESAPKRQAMSAINVGWVKRIPQLSKGRAHLVIITQEINLGDCVFINPVFLRGIWKKWGKTTVQFSSQSLRRNIRFRNLPRTTIKFDPYRLATFKLEEVNLEFQLLPRPLKVLTLYGDGKSFSQIQKELTIEHPEIVKRELTKACRAVSLTLSQHTTEGKRLTEICEKTT